MRGPRVPDAFVLRVGKPRPVPYLYEWTLACARPACQIPPGPVIRKDRIDPGRVTMNTYRRFLAMFLVILSCLFTIQSAAAFTTSSSKTLRLACVDLATLPANYPLSSVLPADTGGHCGLDQMGGNTVAGGSLCGDVGPLPGNRPQSSVLPAHAGSACALLQPDHNTVASGDAQCAPVTSLPANFPDWIEKPTCLYVEAGTNVTAATDMCSAIGPTVFNLGLGVATFASAPACVGVQTDSVAVSTSADRVEVPIEGSITAMNSESAVIAQDAANDDSSATFDPPVIIRGRASSIGPTI